MALPGESFPSDTACAMCMIVKIGDAALWISAMQYFYFYNLYSEELTKLRVWDRLFEGFYALFFIVVLPE